MSHVVDMQLGPDQQIQDLFALKGAAERCGMVFMEGQRTFKFWGGATQECDHAVQVGNGREMGLVPAADQPGSWGIQLDAYDRQSCDNMLMFYQMECARLEAESLGDQYEEELQEDGSYVVTVDTSMRMGA